jgi:hypothetical protein
LGEIEKCVFSREITTVGHNSVQTPKPALFPENPPQEAISLFGPLWGGVAENAGLSRFLPLRAISRFGPLGFPSPIRIHFFVGDVLNPLAPGGF